MMSDGSSHVFPETEAKIARARSMDGRPWEDRLVRYRNIGSLLAERSREHPAKNWMTFLDESGGSSCLTFSEFDDAVRRTATLLRKLDVRRGDKVATLLVNDPRTVIVYFAAWMIGAVVVPVNIGEDDGRVEFILRHSGVRAAFALPEQLERIEPFLPVLTSTVRVDVTRPFALSPSGVEDQETLDFDNAVAACAPIDDTPDIPVDAECLIVYTSGTTGAPKGVVLDQYNLLSDARAISQWHGFGPRDRAMCVLPIHHVNGTVVTLVTPLYSGGSVVLNRKFSAHAFWRSIADERVTWVSVVPTVLAFLSERRDDLSQLDLSRFRHFICGAGPLTTELAARFDDTHHLRVVHGYGLSETTCYSSFLPVDLNRTDYRHWMTECGYPSIGCPIVANDMDIHDVDGRSVKEGERGEIVARGHNVMKYYFERPDANRDSFSHGWFRTGDEGFYKMGADGNQYFFITGRLKELIIRGAVNYSPFEIDEVLATIPGVKAGMAVGFENDFYGEEIGAYVRREDGVDIDEAAILTACRAKLPFAKCPKVVVFGDTFPVTSTGKYQRLQLRPLFAAWKSTNFRDTSK